MGTTSKRGAVTKFQEGVDGNIRDAYLNMENDLFLIKSSSQYLDCSNDARFDFDNTTSFGISFWCRSNAGGTEVLISKFDGTTWFIIQHNAGRWDFTIDDGPNQYKILLSKVEDSNWHHILAVYDASANFMYLYRDAKLIGSIDTTGLGDFSNAVDLTIGGRPVNPFYSDSNINHVAVFNTAPSQEDADFLSSNGGIIPKNLHTNCVGHWSLIERYAYDNGVDNVFFDSVEQYNYAKVTPLTAIHAKAINFTDAELGVVNPSSQTSKKNFYLKENNLWGLLNFLDTGDKLTFGSNTNWDNINYVGTATLTLNIAGSSIDCSAIGTLEWIEIRDNTNTVLTRLNCNEYQGTTIVDIVGSNNATLSGWTASEVLVGGGAWLEKYTLLPEIKQALLIETGISFGTSFTSIVGMGFDIELLTDIAALSEIITGLPTITGFYINGYQVANESALITAINLNNICHIDLEWSSASPTLTFVHTGENYNIARDYYLDELLEPLDKIYLTNNILLANPSKQLQSKFNYYALHNEGNYIAGATNPENVPLIDLDTIGNRESLGWTGADATAKLADLVTNLSLINGLR